MECQKTTQVSSIHLSITEIEFDGLPNPCDHVGLSCLNWQAETKQEYKNKKQRVAKDKKIICSIKFACMCLIFPNPTPA
jgi:hypothetical protein